jgi:hypothetical protein
MRCVYHLFACFIHLENSSVFLRLLADFQLVVLLDEADVFLEERGLTDLERNALVSGTLTTCLTHYVQLTSIQSFCEFWNITTVCVAAS